MSTPDLTKAQLASILAAVAAVIGVVQTAPVRIQVVLVIVIGALGVAWIISDAILRHGRAGSAAAQHNLAAAQIAAAPLDQGDAAP